MVNSLLLIPAAIAVHRYVLLGEITGRYQLSPTSPRFQHFFLFAVVFELPVGSADLSARSDVPVSRACFVHYLADRRCSIDHSDDRCTPYFVHSVSCHCRRCARRRNGAMHCPIPRVIPGGYSSSSFAWRSQLSSSVLTVGLVGEAMDWPKCCWHHCSDVRAVRQIRSDDRGLCAPRPRGSTGRLQSGWASARYRGRPGLSGCAHSHAQGAYPFCKSFLVGNPEGFPHVRTQRANHRNRRDHRGTRWRPTTATCSTPIPMR